MMTTNAAKRHDASPGVEDDLDAIVLASLTVNAWSGRPIVLVILVNRQIEIVWLEYFLTLDFLRRPPPWW
jgi:hypothetical protein